MGSKDRILRQKEETRNSILVASYKIVKEEGWEGLNMRKIADHIEYTAPTIYEYFPNKQAILEELTRKGFHCLSDKVKKAKLTQTDPAVQLEVMWIAFWNFAFKNKELYQIMFGVEMKCYTQYSIPDTETTCQLFLNTIAAVMETQRPTAADIQLKYFMFFSVIHGLISVNMIGNRLTVATNDLIFKDAVSAIIKSLHKQEILS